jgi:hypothetical protein
LALLDLKVELAEQVEPEALVELDLPDLLVPLALREAQAAQAALAALAALAELAE